VTGAGPSRATPWCRFNNTGGREAPTATRTPIKASSPSEAPVRIDRVVSDVEVAATDEYLHLTLDVGHAKAEGTTHERCFVRFDDRIRTVRPHDSGGTDAEVDPLPE
jgi:hypothetical protein